MLPFRVTCETCNARLKVGDASAIGQIHACPKCGSMVLIQPPTKEQASAAGGMSDKSVEITPVMVPTFDVADLTELPQVMPAVETPLAEVQTPIEQATIVEGLPAIVWWGACAAVVLMIGGLLGAVFFGGGDEPPAVAQVANRVAVGDEPSASQPAVVDTNIEPSAVDDSTEAPIADAVVDQATADPMASEALNEVASAKNSDVTGQVASDGDTVTEPVSPSQQSAVAEASSEATKNESVAVVNSPELPVLPTETRTEPSESIVAKKSPVMKFDPLDFDPAHFSFNASTAVDVQSQSASEQPMAENGEPVVEEVKPAESAPVDSGTPAPEIDRTISVRLGPMPQAANDRRQLTEQLTTSVESFLVRDVPLNRFAEMVSELAGFGVTLDPVELELAGVSASQPVSVLVQSTTVEKLLREVFAKQRLEVLEEEGQVNIALVGGDKQREVVYDVADLVAGNDARPIADYIEQFVSPQVWKGEGVGVDGTKLEFAKSQHVRHKVLIFIERLRLARGLSQKSRYPAALLHTTSPYAAMAAKLNVPTTFTFLPWNRLADVVRDWESSSGLTILVDWNALADLQLGIGSPVSCSAVGRTWADVLDAILEPLELGWWAVDGATIQITGRDRLREIERVEFYSVPDDYRQQFTNSSALVESIVQNMNKLEGDASDEAALAVMQVDEPSGKLIVRATPAVHRHLSERFGGAGK